MGASYRQLTRLTAAWALLGGLVVISIVLVTAVNVGAFAAHRVAVLFGGSVAGLPGYEDYVRLAIGAAAPMFLPWCQARHGHLAVDLFMNQAPLGVQRVVDTVSLVLLAAAAFFLAYWMVIGMFETRADHVLSRVLGWPEWPFYIPGFLSLFLWGLVSIAQLIVPAEDQSHG